MVANPVIYSLLWIMGFVTLIGNTIILTLKELVFHRKSNKTVGKGNSFVKVANSCFIFNPYHFRLFNGCIGVVSQGMNYSGHHCFVDKEWRSSNRCRILGTVSVLSSDASAFIMASLSTFRLVSICKPFQTRTMKFKWILLVGLLCWSFSLLFVFRPWIQLKYGYFVFEVWFPNHYFKTDIVSKDNLITIANQVSGSNSTLQSWFKAKRTILDKFKYNEIKAEFGFYSQNKCLYARLLYFYQ